MSDGLPQGAAPQPLQTPLSARARRMLIVDDDRDALYSLQRILQRPDLAITVAEGGEEALARFSQARQECVLMDVRMPGHGGIETARRMRMVDPRVPVILMSAFDSAQVRQEAMVCGAFGFVRKPLNVGELRAITEAALETGAFNCSRPVSWPSSLAEALPGTSASILSIQSALRLVLDDGGPNDAKARRNPLTVLRVQGPAGAGRHHLALALARLWQGGAASVPLVHGGAADAEDRLLAHVGNGHRCMILTAASPDLPAFEPAAFRRVAAHFSRMGSGHEGLIVAVADGAGTAKPLGLREVAEHTVALPGLSDRAEDIPYLAASIAQSWIAINRPALGRTEAITPGFARQLMDKPWPGNLPQLESVLHGILEAAETYPVRSAPGFEVGPEDPASKAVSTSGRSAEGDELLVPTTLIDRLFEELRLVQPLPPGLDMFDLVERRLIQRAMEYHNGNQSKASRFLGITRNTLRKRLTRYGLNGAAYSSSSSASSSSSP